VDGLGDEFFAGAALAGDQDGQGGAGDALDGAEDASHGLAGGDDPLEALVLDEFGRAGASRGVPAGRLVAEQDGLGGAVDQCAEDLEVERFFDEVKDAFFEGSACGGDVAVGGDHDGLGLGLERAGGVEDDEAGVGAVACDGLGVGGCRGGACGGGHAQVGDDDVKGAVLEFVEGLGDSGGDGADVPGLAESLGHDVGVVGFVVDEEDLCAEVFGHRKVRVGNGGGRGWYSVGVVYPAGMVDIRVISIGALAGNPLWGERTGVRSGHATSTLIRSGDVTLLVDPGLPEQALVARLGERSGLTPELVTHVFLTSFHPDAHRGIGAFAGAEWLISLEEREGVGIPLVQQLKVAVDRGEKELAELLKHQIAVLHKCKVAPDELASGVDLFPLPGLTPGLTGVLIEEPELTTLVCGDAIATVEHLRKRMVLQSAASVPRARESFAEAIQIADVLVLGRDNSVVNPFDAGNIAGEV